MDGKEEGKGEKQMRLVSYQQHRGMSRLADALNMSPEWLWDVQNGYIDKDNNIQMRNGIAKYNATAIYETPNITYLAEIKWNSGTKDVICYTSNQYWWRYFSASNMTARTISSINGSTLTLSGTHGLETYHIGKPLYNSTTQTTTYITALPATDQITVASVTGMNQTNAVDDLAGWGRISGTQGGTSRGMAAMFNNILYLADGSTPREVSSAYAVSNVGGSPPSDASAVWVHNEHVIWNSAAAPSNVYISAYRNGEDYTTSNDAMTLTLNYVTPEADAVIGFSTYSEDLLIIIGKKYIVTYNAPEDVVDWSKQDMIESGGISAHANCTYGQNLYIPGRQGVNTYITLAQSREVPLDDITYQTAPLYQSYISSLGSSAWGNVSAVIDRLLDLMYICFPLSGGHEILVYSFLQNQVAGRYTGITAHSFARLEDGTILIGGASGRAYTMNSGATDDGTIITFAVTTPYYNGNNENYKVCRYGDVRVKHTATFTLTYKYQWEDGAQTSMTQSLASNTPGMTRFKTGNILGRGKKVQIVIQHSTTSGVVINIPEWALGFIDEGFIK